MGVSDVLVVGAGGVGRYVAEQLRTVPEWQRRWRVVGFVERDPRLHRERVDGLSVLGGLEELERISPGAVFIALGSPQAKREIVGQVGQLTGFDFPTLVHPRAWVSESAEIGSGTLVYPGATINHHVRIGDFVTVNMGVVLGHDVEVRDYASVAPQVGLAGHTILETGVAFGIGACTIQDCRVGAWSNVGAGAVVINDIPPHTVAVGVPARPITSRQETGC